MVAGVFPHGLILGIRTILGELVYSWAPKYPNNEAVDTNSHFLPNFWVLGTLLYHNGESKWKRT